MDDQRLCDSCDGALALGCKLMPLHESPLVPVMQVAAGACGEPWMSTASLGAPHGYCQASCHRCPCTDIPPPPADYTCAQQVLFAP